MIFSHTHKQVLDGTKSQTCRLCRDEDEFGTTPTGELAVLERAFPLRGRMYRRPRWIVGHEYSVQPERCHKAVGRIRITEIRRVDDVVFEVLGENGLEFARAEGFASVNDFVKVWMELHPRAKAEQPVWVLTFDLVKPIEIRINTRDEHGRKQKLDPKTAETVGALFKHAAERITEAHRS